MESDKIVSPQKCIPIDSDDLHVIYMMVVFAALKKRLSKLHLTCAIELLLKPACKEAAFF